ncbi:hypothetical protein SAMN04244548_01209 [Paracoccus pantotrophus]|nr:hypothetical protein SAMN04244548_01209 [Paracoccus pantotrophus]
MSADDAGLLRRSVFGRLMAAATEARSGLAATIAPKLKPDGSKPTTPDLTARAVRVSNRNKAAAQRYLRLHQILANKPSSDPENIQ